MQNFAFLRTWPLSNTFLEQGHILEMQIFACQEMEANFLFFLSIFPTDFEQINGSQCK